MRILGLSGSLRRASFNTSLLHAARELAPDGVVIEPYDYRDVPLYDGDLPRPEGVDRLVAALSGADALLIATPEYNHSLPGVLKNALDWASRPAYASALLGRPTGIVSAATGAIGGARAQAHLKTVLLGIGTPVFAAREVAVGMAADRFDAEGRLAHEPTRAFLAGWLRDFTAWVAASPAPPTF